MIVRQRYSSPVLDQKFDQLTRSFFDPAARPTEPFVKGAWAEDGYVLTVDLPGVPAEAVGVEVVGDHLHLSVDHDELRFDRKLRLNAKLDANKVSARYLDGRLTVAVGRVDAPEARTVAIDTSPEVAAIEASADESTTESTDQN